MKYKLINIKTKQETLCDKVTIDGYDYYVNDENQEKGAPIIHKSLRDKLQYAPDEFGSTQEHWFKVIATNNPNINVPKVVDKVKESVKLSYEATKNQNFANGKHEEAVAQIYFRRGYNKSQETHPNSDEDTIEFGQWVSHNDWVYLPSKKYWVNEEQEELEQKLSSQELLQLWKEQQPKTVYYE